MYSLQEPRSASTPQPPPLPPQPSVLIAEAELLLHEIQDLADAMGELTSAAAGNELQFRLRIELGGKTFVTGDLVEKLNLILQRISDKLRFN